MAYAPIEYQNAVLTALVRTQAPVRAEWIRRVTRVVDLGGIQMFEGMYLPYADEAATISVRPGSLLLVATDPHAPPQRVIPYIYLPEDLWYTPSPDGVRRTTGWHMQIRPLVMDWISVERSHRVVRACTEAIIELRANAGLTADAAVTGDAIAHFELAMRMAIQPHTPEPDHRIEARFRRWAEVQAPQSTRSVQEIIDVVVRCVGPPQMHPVPQSLRNSLTTLATLTDGSNADTLHVHAERVLPSASVLVQMQQTCENVMRALEEEIATREWQNDVLSELGIPDELRTHAACNRRLTELLRNQEWGRARSEMRFYTGRLSEEDLARAVDRVAERDTTTAEAVDTREDRNIRIGRRRDVV